MPQLILTITYDTDQDKLHVAGPIDNKMLCYGLLERAKDALRDYKPVRQEPSKIIPATTMPPHIPPQ